MRFEDQERILRKNTGMLPRSYNEAVKGADYAQWFYPPKSETQMALEWFADLFIFFVWVIIAGLGIGSVVYWVLYL